jgi:SpoVK/Ycf46/Vps4 family AAA+-type ATPase
VDENDIGYPDENKPFESLFYNEAVGSVVNEVQTWLKNESWFRRKSIPWKRGYLLHGTPGTGKTAFVRALAQELDMPIISFDLSTMMNDDLAVAWRDCDLHKPCIALFEDIDSTFDGRENVSSCGDDGLSFGYFLNTLDGVSKSDGVIIIITTNDIEKVDPALGSIETETMTSRPCRIDRIIKFDVLTKDAREKMAERILGEFDKKVWKDIFKGSEKDTGSQFQERCCRRALQLFWEKSQETEGCE